MADWYEVARLATEDVFGPGQWHDPRPGACPGCMICDKEKYMATRPKSATATAVAKDQHEDEGSHGWAAEEHKHDEPKTVRGAHAAMDPVYPDPQVEAEMDDRTREYDVSDQSGAREEPTRLHLDVPEGNHTNLTIDGDTVLFGNRIVGEFDGKTLSLNAGWCRLAGLGVKIDGDTSDRRRVVFDRRPVTDHTLTSRA